MARNSSWVVWGVAGAFGIALALWIFPLGFLFPVAGAPYAPQGDAAQHAIVQQYFIRDAWRWPPLVAANLHTPEGLNIAFADGIPLLAMILKLLAPVLPEGFHGIGLWYGIALALQPVAAVWALRGTGERRWLPALAAALLAAGMPAFLARYGHAALTGHFLILVGLGFYLRLVRAPRSPRLWALAALAQVLTLLVHPYLAVMTLALLAAVPTTLLRRRDGAWLPAGVAVALAVGAVLGVMALFGYLGARGEPGYGQYALNLLSPVWPAGSWLLGGLSPGFVDATGFGGWEGYNWLGLGLMAGLAVLLALRPGLLLATLRRHAGLVLALLALTLIAVSHRVGFGGRVLLDLGQVPAVLEQFRASGRFFWPVGLTLGIAVLALLPRAFPGQLGVALALAAGLLQFLDAAPLRQDLRRLTSQHPAWVVPAAELRPVIAEHRFATLLPSWFCMPPMPRAEMDAQHHRLLELLALTAERARPVNTMYIARWRETPRCRDAELAAKPLAAGELRILLPAARATLLPLIPDAARHCRPLGELTVCSDPAGEERGDGVTGPRLRPGRVSMRLGEGGRPLLAGGFDAPRDELAWTVARRASLVARHQGAPLRLEFELIGYAPRAGGSRAVVVSLDGREAARWTLPDGEAVTRALDLPVRRAPATLRIDFTIEDPTRPAERDGGADQRRLGFALRAITVRPR